MPFQASPHLIPSKALNPKALNQKLSTGEELNEEARCVHKSA